MSYLGGVALIFIVIVGGLFGLYMIMSHASMTAPVDTDGVTTGLAENNTRATVASSGVPIMYLAGGVALIAGFLILVTVAVYFAGAGRGGYKNRY